MLLGNGAYTNIRANSTCDLGTSSVPFQNVYSNASLVGTTNSRTVNSIVSGPGSSVSNNLPAFSGTSGVVLQDSGISSTNVITSSGSLVIGDLVSANGTKSITDSGIVAANVITAGTNLISGDLVTANGSKSVSDSGIVASNVITASTNLVSGDLVSANGSKP